MEFWDAHLHTAVELPRWRAAGFAGGVLCATGHSGWAGVLEECAASDGVLRPALGVHPWHVPSDFPQERCLAELAALLKANPGCMLGEIGLDGAPGRPPLETQVPWFSGQLDLAARFRRPAVLHLVRCWQASMAILESRPDVPVLVHGFHGSWQVALRLLQLPRLQLSVGFDALRCGGKFREALERIPRERLMVDSDWPFRGHSPDQLPRLIDFLARLRGEDPEGLGAVLVANARAFFAVHDPGIPFPPLVTGRQIPQA